MGIKAMTAGQRVQVRAAIKREFPTVFFQTKDGMGTRMDPSILHSVIPHTVDVKAFERFVESLGFQATWPTCSQIYAKYRTVSA
jgi:hypothetical protein